MSSKTVDDEDVEKDYGTKMSEINLKGDDEKYEGKMSDNNKEVNDNNNNNNNNDEEGSKIQSPSGKMRKRPSKLSIPKNQDSGRWFGGGKTGSGERTIAASKQVIAMTDLNQGVFEDDWELQSDIGKGSTSTVYKCRKKIGEKLSNIFCAVKIVSKKRLGFGRRKETILNHIRNEVDVLRKIGSHPCIVKLVAAYESKEQIHIVTELMEGGELFDYICDQEQLTEKEAVLIVRRISSALAYLHSNNIIHRDLKPENLLLKSKNDISEIKVIDFGFSKIASSRTKSFLGTQGYLAPEMLDPKGYTQAVDMWALGVCVYAILSGYLPFDDDLDEEGPTYTLQFPEEQWSNVSKEGKDFISKLLIVDPAKRLTSDRVNKHPWLARRAELGVAYLNSPKAFRGAKEKKSSKSWRARLLSTGETRLM